MKKNLLFLIALVGTTMLFAQSSPKRTVLIEEFTNASCPPCAAQNPAFHALLTKNVKNVVTIKWQTSFPGADPMNAQNKAEITTRTGYYAVKGVPEAVIDGVVPDDSYADGKGGWQVAQGGYAGGPYGYNQNVLDYATSQVATASVETSHTLNAAKDSIFITVKVNNSSASKIGSTTLRLQVALLEQTINFAKAPGTNGEKEFFGIVRKSYPNALGTAVDSVAAKGSRTYTFKAKLPTYIYDKKQIAVVSFLQDDATKAVMNSSISYPINSFDAALTLTSTGPEKLCDKNEFIASGTITNNSAVAIDSLEAVISYNGITFATKKVSKSIAPTKSENVDFGKFVLPYGATAVKVEVKNINKGGIDYNTFDNYDEQFFKVLPSVAVGTNVNEGFEKPLSGAQPENATFIDNFPTCTIVDKSISTAASAKLGAYAKSNKSFRFDIWGTMANPKSIGNLVFHKINLKNAKKAQLKFSWAFAQYEDATTPATQDSLEVLISTDCGENYESVWLKSGDELKTTTPKAAAAFYPTATQWATDSISVSQYDGKNDVMIAFVCHSDYGNNMFIDDIFVDSKKQNVGTQDLFNNEAVAIYPNPMADETSIEVTTNEAVEVSVSVFNTLGQQVAARAYGKLVGENILPFVAGDLANGIYTIHVKMGDKLAVKKVTVQK